LVLTVGSLARLLGRQLALAWKRRWPALGLCWAICLGGWIGVQFLPSQYASGARLYVDTDAVLTPLLHGIAIDSAQMSQVEMLQRTLLSVPNLERVIAQTALNAAAPDATARERLVQILGRQIRVSPQTKNLFTIEYQNADPHLAYDVVRTLLAIFVDTATESRRADLERGQRFVEEQISSYEQKLRAAELRRAEFRAKYVDLLPSDASGGLSRLDVARSQVRTLQGQLQDAIGARDALKQELVATQPMLVTEAAGPGGSNPLAEAERRLQELRLRYTEQNPDVINARNLVAALRQSGGGQPEAATSAATRARSVPNPVYEHLKVQLVTAESTVASLNRQVEEAVRERDRLEAVARADPELQAEYLNIDRDYTVLQKNYEELLSRREAMRISAAADDESGRKVLQVVDPPQPPLVPVSPQKRLYLTVAVLGVGLAGGAGLAFMLAQLDRSFTAVDQLRGLGLAVLGGISLLDPAASRKRMVEAATFGLATALIFAVFAAVVTGRVPSPATFRSLLS
jgi:polysaccharide chain length determinant protein (PEP-CTERM system associated)